MSVAILGIGVKVTRKHFDSEIRRLDDLRQAESRRVDEQMGLRSDHIAQLREAEAKRIDAIRSVDVNAVAIASDRSAAQALVLANQVAASADTLRALVASTADMVAKQLTDITTQFTARLAALEKSQYEKSGSSLGMRDLYGWIVAAIMAVVTVYSLFKK